MKTLIFLLTTLISVSGFSQIKHGLRDTNGRHIIARGFVVNTDDGVGEIFYHADDYLRMARMGANYQVIRLAMGKLSTFEGSKLEQSYLLKLDSLVLLGKNRGIKSVF